MLTASQCYTTVYVILIKVDYIAKKYKIWIRKSF